ncbi:MAG: RNA pseudouridine synthase [Puniceicoccales bacterium]|jgi:23S rRNA-/tRNA-specific pseudouridylate synthase|nr:RNA pseudouridine synthase [Puniceicoccales bacterium]
MAHPNALNTSSPKAIVPQVYDFERECYRLPNGRSLFVLNRLDAPTSGVMLMTMDEAVAKAVKSAFRERRCHKLYQAWVKRGAAIPTSGIWQDALRETQRSQGLRVQRSPKGQFAETRYEIVEAVRIGAYVLWRLFLSPHTGRTHQLRVQCALRKCPILGDKTYGDFRWNRSLAKLTGRENLFLHSKRMELSYQLNGKIFHFYAEQLPDDFWNLGGYYF